MPNTYLARVGRWCFHRRWTVLAIWIIAVVGGVIAAGPVFASLNDGNGPKSLESVQASNLIDANSTSAGTLDGVVSGVNPTSASVRTVVLAAAAQIRQIPGVQSVATPYDAGLSAADAANLTSSKHDGVLIEAKLKNVDDDAVDAAAGTFSTRMHAVPAALSAAGVAHATVLVGGGPLVNTQADAQAQKDLSGAEELSLPITLVILAFVFGGIIAAGLPVLAAIVSIAGSMGVLLVFSKLTNLDQNTVTVITLLGLGLSIDYGLLLVARYRDELRAGFAPADAVSRAWATAGRTIVFSALTVAASMCGMLVFGVTALSALGAAGVSIALVAMLVSLTLTGGLLGFVHRRVKPVEAGRPSPIDGSGFFGGLAALVQRRPLLTALGTGAALLAAGLPLLTMTVHMDDFDGLPRSLESVKVVDVLSADYRQAPSPAVTVVARTSAASLDAWAHGFATDADVTRVYPAEQVSSTLAVVSLDAKGSPEGSAALRLVDDVRAHRPAGTRSWVTGDAAVHRDVIGLIMHRLPYAIGLTLVAMLLLLFAMTGSVVVPLKAALMNVVSIGATFGVLDAVFEHGFAAGLLHTTTVVGISPFVIVTVFAFAFGLSMDYEVFLLARIQEQVDRGVPTDIAVRRGLQRSGRIITSAALLMVVVFGCFVTGRIGNVQQIGLGLAVAVAIDATLVRCVLVPATMTLLGDWNWWSPRFLTRLHRGVGFSHHEVSLPDLPVPDREPALTR